METSYSSRDSRSRSSGADIVSTLRGTGHRVSEFCALTSAVRRMKKILGDIPARLGVPIAEV